MDSGPKPSRVRPFLPDEPEPIAAPVPPDAAGAVSSLRPYLLTGGRVEPTEPLEIEAQVMTTETGRLMLDRLSYEQRDIVRLCRRPYAVAEVAVHLRLHLGVARVLAGDLVALGYLSVRRADPQPLRNVRLLERVIQGLEAL
jgi:hypothetical protein